MIAESIIRTSLQKIFTDFGGHYHLDLSEEEPYNLWDYCLYMEGDGEIIVDVEWRKDNLVPCKYCGRDAIPFICLGAFNSLPNLSDTELSFYGELLENIYANWHSDACSELVESFSSELTMDSEREFLEFLHNYNASIEDDC